MQRRRVRLFYILLHQWVWLLVGLAVLAAVLVDPRGDWAERNLYLVAGSLALMLGLLFVLIVPNAPAEHYLRSQMDSFVQERPGALVRPTDPDAVFCELVPPENVTTLRLDEAHDLGYLRIDPDSGALLLEGNLNRYLLMPADILDLETVRHWDFILAKPRLQLAIQADGSLFRFFLGIRGIRANVFNLGQRTEFTRLLHKRFQKALGRAESPPPENPEANVQSGEDS